MRYRSTRGGGDWVAFSEAVFEGMAPHGGLYVSEYIPPPELEPLRNLDYPSLVAHILGLYSDLEPACLERLARGAYGPDYGGPVAPLRADPWGHQLELFYGPTLSFKDVALQLLGQLLEELLAHRGQSLNLLVATSEGRGYRLSLESFWDSSTRAGRRFARPSEGEEVVAVLPCSGAETLLCVSRNGRCLQFAMDEVSYLTGAAKGVTLVKLESGDRLLAVKLCNGDEDGLWLRRSDGGKPFFQSAGATALVARGGVGKPLIKRGSLELAEETGEHQDSE